MSLPPNSNIQTLLSQLLAATQGQAAPRAPTNGPGDLASTLTALAMLAPQLTAALQPPASSNEADESNSDRLSDTYRRANMKFKFNKRPTGTAGRGDFKLEKLMGLNSMDYELFLRTVKDATHVAGLDRTQMMKFQDERKLARARSKIIKALPGLSIYADCKWPYWPVDAGLLLDIRGLAELAENPPAHSGDTAANADDPANADSTENTNDAENTEADRMPDATPSTDMDDDYDGDEIGDRTTASVHELDEIADVEANMDTDEEESLDEQEEEEMDDTPPAAPPAYNSTPAPMNLSTDTGLAVSTTRKAGSCKSSPVVAPVRGLTPGNDRAQPPTPTNVDPLGSTTPTTRSRRNNKAAGSVSIAPASNIVVTSTTGAAPATSTLSYAATTTTTIQAQALSTTGVPHEPGNAAGYAWLPVSKRPPIPPVQNPATPNPADPTAKPKRGKKTVTAAPLVDIDTPMAPSEATQPKPKPKGRAAKASNAVPAPDPEATEAEPAPAAKTTRKRAGAGANANKVAAAKPTASGSRPRSK
ncbi:hypothetical protein RhiLY_13128 [Ceratobasidium sp. AG-Ba]|nr:hypothetical protein RhiLY_13128 [Ceratobasidium sp. AG-Ba]